MKKVIVWVFIIFISVIWLSCAWADNEKIVIKRDGYGVSHVYAESVFGIFYGYGYSIARDRLFQIDMVRYTGQGRAAEVLGSEYVDFDKKIRANYQPGSIREQLQICRPKTGMCLKAMQPASMPVLKTSRKTLGCFPGSTAISALIQSPGMHLMWPCCLSAPC